jgi:hypothetical protein
MREAIAAHLGSRQVSRILYGSIIGLALIVALEAHPPGAGTIALTLLATAVAVALAELYSDIVGTATRTRARIGWRQMSGLLDEAGAVAVGIAFPGVFFVLAAVGAFGIDSAFAVAKWSGLGLISAYGFAAARLTGESLLGSVLRAGIAALIAAFLIIIKALVH